MGRWLGFGMVCLLLVGCAAQTAAPSDSTTPQPVALRPAELLREQLSGGSFQADAAIETISQSVEKAQLLVQSASSPESRQGSREVLEIIELCGMRLAEFVEDAPSVEELEQKFSYYDERRLKAIEAGNDCLHDLFEAHGILESLLEGAPIPFAKSARSLDAQLLRAIDDVMGAVKAFGGEIEIAD